jgi:diacylglycerol kinase (ATP)
VIVANPTAGGGFEPDALARLLEDGAELRETGGPGSAARLASAAAREGADLVVAAGGDGTVHEVVAGLLESSPPPALGLIPLGTGNDLARSLGIPADVEDAVEILRGGRRRKLDLVRAELDGEAQVCVNAAVGGFSGRVADNADADLKSRWGPLSYLRSALDAIGELEPWAVTIVLDGREHRLSALNVVIANGRYAGAGIPIAPRADPFDGLLDLAVVLEASLLRLTRLAPTLLRGEDPGDDSFLTRAGRELTLEAERPMPFSVDGERVEVGRARFRLEPGAIEVIVPRGAGEGEAG